MDKFDTEAIHRNAADKGFWDVWYRISPYDEERKTKEFNFIAKQLMMITSEVVEVMEAVRKSKGSEEIESEFADIMIRVGDLWEGMKAKGYVDGTLNTAIYKKTSVNQKRGPMHGVLG